MSTLLDMCVSLHMPSWLLFCNYRVSGLETVVPLVPAIKHLALIQYALVAPRPNRLWQIKCSHHRLAKHMVQETHGPEFQVEITSPLLSPSQISEPTFQSPAPNRSPQPLRLLRSLRSPHAHAQPSLRWVQLRLEVLLDTTIRSVFLRFWATQP